MRTIGVAGAGTMGAGIAQAAARAACRVKLFDLSGPAVDAALARIRSDLDGSVRRGKLTAEEAHHAFGRIEPAAALEELADEPLVIEAVAEQLDVKQELFRRLEAACRPSAILASNTSSLSITAVAVPLAHPERVVGLHFFNPAHVMKLVEVVRGHRTSDETILEATAFVRLLGKTPVQASDTPGFIVNRIARPFYGEALRILGEGIAGVEDIDRIVRLEGGFRMGPFELMDLIGIDINLAVTRSMYEQTFHEPRYRPHIIQTTMVNAGLLGRKTKRGFYSYDR